MSFHSLQAFMVSSKKSTDSLIRIFLNVTLHFLVQKLDPFSLSCTLESWTIKFYHEDLTWSYLFRLHNLSV